jgi:hypothetical protein
MVFIRARSAHLPRVAVRWLAHRFEHRRPAGRTRCCHRMMLAVTRRVVIDEVKWANLPAGFPP